MNTNWSKILLFTLLGFALGFITSRLTSHHGGCDEGGMECHPGSCPGHAGKSMCDHGGSCCSGPNSHCDKEGCDHKMGAACCKGGHGMHGEHGMGGDAKADAIVKGLQDSNFQGDTTIAIDGGTVKVYRKGDSTSVRVEMTEHRMEEHHNDEHAH